jgi:presenilin-like A22 family membrane protease
MRMTNQFENVNLSCNTFNITHILYFLLLKDFYGDLLAGKIVISKFYFTKRAFSNGLAYLKV